MRRAAMRRGASRSVAQRYDASRGTNTLAPQLTAGHPFGGGPGSQCQKTLGPKALPVMRQVALSGKLLI